jgi:hypothetical protein
MEYFMKQVLLLTTVILLLSLNLIGQTFTINNIDRSNYPIISGDIIPYDANGNRITVVDPHDWIVWENGNVCEVTEMYCPQATRSQIPVSSILNIDISGSMEDNYRMIIAKESAKAWVTTMSSKTETCIYTFDDYGTELIGFSQNKSNLNTHINNIEPNKNGGTNFKNGLSASMEKFNQANNESKVLVFLTDGIDDNFSQEEAEEVVRIAGRKGIKIFAFTIDGLCSDELKYVSENTAGKWYENINTTIQARYIYSSILQYEQNDSPCRISWRTTVSRTTPITKLRVSSPQNQLDITFGEEELYDLSKTKALGNTLIHDFGLLPEGRGARIKLTITAVGDIDLSDIKLVGDNNFELEENLKNTTLVDGESIDLVINYRPNPNQTKVNGRIEIQLSDQTLYIVNLSGGVDINSSNLDKGVIITQYIIKSLNNLMKDFAKSCYQCYKNNLNNITNYNSCINQKEDIFDDKLVNTIDDWKNLFDKYEVDPNEFQDSYPKEYQDLMDWFDARTEQITDIGDQIDDIIDELLELNQKPNQNRIIINEKENELKYLINSI